MRKLPIRLRIAAVLGVAGVALGGTAATGQGDATSYAPPQHVAGWPGLAGGNTESDINASFALGPHLERSRSPKWLLAERRKLDKALGELAKQREGVVDAYVVVVGLDSDPVFGRESREAGKVLARRFGATGRTIVLAGTDGSGPSKLPHGDPQSLSVALARIAELMNPAEDVLVLYTTGHGAKIGLAYHDGDEGYGIIAPDSLARDLDGLGIRNRLLMLSACYSGVFVDKLASDTTALFTAASSERPSFGCMADNDWTFFGDAMVNHALRKPQTLAAASEEARAMIGRWEHDAGLDASNPQASVGSKVSTWLIPLETRMPRTATAPVGRPATQALDTAGQ